MSPFTVTFSHHAASLGGRMSVARGGDDVVRVKVVAGPFPATLVVRSEPTQQTPFDLSKKGLLGCPMQEPQRGLLLPRGSQLDNETR